jgi:hypothetical protein
VSSECFCSRQSNPKTPSVRLRAASFCLGMNSSRITRVLYVKPYGHFPVSNPGWAVGG